MTKETAFILGTAMWGWTLDQAQCFRILDAFYEAGGRWVDGATNYPINKQAEDFRRAEKILQEWIKENGVTDLQIMMKVGSINNMYTPENNLNPSFLLLCGQQYLETFGDQLSCLMIHWDNRGSDERQAIEQSLETLLGFEQLSLGLSGIRHPELYAALLGAYKQSGVWLQMKHNVVYSDYERYRPLHPYCRSIAYGINAGGLKLAPAAYHDKASLLARGGAPEQHRDLVEALQRLVHHFAEDNSKPALQKMNHIGLLHALAHPGIERVLIGVSSVAQLRDSFEWESTLNTHDYQDWYQALREVVNKRAQK